MRYKIKKNKRIHTFISFEKSIKLKNRVTNRSERSLTSKKILHKYNNWKYFFREELNANVLSKYQLWNHESKLISEQQFTFEFIYLFLNRKLKLLHEYLKVNKKIYTKIEILDKTFNLFCIQE